MYCFFKYLILIFALLFTVDSFAQNAKSPQSQTQDIDTANYDYDNNYRYNYYDNDDYPVSRAPLPQQVNQKDKTKSDRADTDLNQYYYY
jgi:hypothetical protein